MTVAPVRASAHVDSGNDDGTSSDTDAFTLVIGRGDERRVGPYRLLRSLGRGGMGAVYLAEPMAPCPVPAGTQVALKILRKVTEEERKRFEREARYLQSLSHPGIVRVFDHAEHQGYPYLVMELIDGRRLDQLIELGQRMDERTCVELGIKALEALHVAHLAGILHRDIKPNNIMVDAQHGVRLLDFGLAQSLDGESRLTRTGNIVGTPAYMSPEQACGEDLSPRSDVYSMGACLYELLTGFQPYSADNPMATLRRILDEPLTRPSRLRRNLTRPLETVVMKAMAKAARDRYASAEAMADDLRRCRDGRPIRGRLPSRLVLLCRWSWRHRRTLMFAALIGFVLISATIVAVRHVLRAAAANLATDAGDAWVVEWHQDADLDATRNTLTNHEPLGKGVRLAQLPPVIGPVRLSVTIERTDKSGGFDAPGLVQLLLSDRDLGRGYRLLYSHERDGDRLVLMREDKVVLTRELGPATSAEPLTLTLEREDANLTARAGDAVALRFRDLVPIEGAEAAAVYVAFTPDALQVRGLTLERRRSGLSSAPLATADTLRQDGRYASALKLYEAFLRDHPDALEGRDARLRLALCVEALGDDERALRLYRDAISANAGAPDYVALATFHAWSCALRLGKYEESDGYFAAIRRGYDLDTLLRAVPQEVLGKLVYDYLTRAEKLSADAPVRAAGLFTTAAQLAAFLKLTDAISQGRTGAGDLFLALGRLDEARSVYDATATDQRLPVALRLKATLKLAEVARVAEQFDDAERTYREVIAHAADEDLAQWARLWLGDLALERGDSVGALATWGASSENHSDPGRIMMALVDSSTAFPESGKGPDSSERFFANDCLYFIARRALLIGERQRYRDGLESVVRAGPANDWPTPLAHHLLERLPLEPQHRD